MGTLNRIEEAILRLKVDEEKWRLGYQTLAMDMSGLVAKNNLKLKSLETSLKEMEATFEGRLKAMESGAPSRKDMERKLRSMEQKLGELNFRRHAAMARLVEDALKSELKDVYDNIGSLRRDVLECQKHKQLIEKANARIDGLASESRAAGDAARAAAKEEAGRLRESLGPSLAGLVPKERFAAEVEKLSKRLDGLELRQQPDIEGMIKERLRQEKQRIDLLLTGVRAVSPQDVAQKALEDMEPRLAATKEALKDAEERAASRIESLEARLAGMEDRADAAERAAARADKLPKRMEDLEHDVRVVEKGILSEADILELFEERFRGQPGRPATAGDGVSMRLKEINEGFDTLSRKIDSIDSTVQRIRDERSAKAEDIDERMRRYKDFISETNDRISSVEDTVKESFEPLMDSLRLISDNIKRMKTKSHA
jgi:chromosome segregation ATPase